MRQAKRKSAYITSVGTYGICVVMSVRVCLVRAYQHGKIIKGVLAVEHLGKFRKIDR